MDDHQALDEAMDDRRNRLRLRWNQVAEHAGMSVQHLSRIRSGKVPLNKFSASGIDAALQWPTGTAWARYSGEPDPAGDTTTTRRRPPVGSPEWVAYLATELPEEDFREVIERLIQIKKNRRIMAAILDAVSDESLVERHSP